MAEEGGMQMSIIDMKDWVEPISSFMNISNKCRNRQLDYILIEFKTIIPIQPLDCINYEKYFLTISNPDYFFL